MTGLVRARAEAAPGREPDPLRELRNERDRFVGFAFAAADLLLEVTERDVIAFAAGAAKALTGAAPEALSGREFRTLFAASDRAIADLRLRQGRASGRIEPTTLQLDPVAGPAVAIVLSGCRLPSRGDTLYLAVSLARPPAGLAGFEPQRDPVTGLLDSQSFVQVADVAMASAQARGETLAMSLLQLQGIEALRARSGDEDFARLLAEIGAFLRVQASDGTGAARLSDDKFGVLRPDAAPSGALASAIERLSRTRDPSARGLAVSERTVCLAQGDLSAEDATRALAFTLECFVSAPSGEFTIASLVEGFHAQVAETVARISRLKNAMLDRGLDVAFQPIVRLADRRVHHFEMLARFEPEKSPFELIQFAERIGMIEGFDLCICQHALTQLGATADSEFEVAVNVSGRSIGSDAFVQALMALLAGYGALRRRVMFEVTESTTITDLTRAARVLGMLRQAGHRICLDDFGAGASSFQYLRALPVDFVKIDGAYVAGIGRDRRDRAILKAMVSLCCDLEVGTIAEQIERESQRSELAALGVVFGQGYLFGRPAPLLTALGPTPPAGHAAAS